MSVLEVLLEPLHDGQRWCAQATGEADGARLVVRVEGYDRADVAREAVIRWFAASERQSSERENVNRDRSA